ncbi:hypothetical protein ALI144C_23140 [Actinosynnema sp. ALI-1.44]|nr:hypothetical protein ALI144C_23140 [Actinosynnema sp. ALI-1.44]
MDAPYWREEQRQGRLNRPRIDVFLNYWLTMRRAHVVPSDRIFTDFRDHVLAGSPDVRPVLDELSRDSACYRQLAQQPPFSVPGTFYYRVIEVLDIAATMPVLLWLMRPASGVAAAARDEALQAVESWVVRRTLSRVTLADTNSTMVELLHQLHAVEPAMAGQVARRFLAAQTSETRRWPGDDQVVESLTGMRLYTALVPRRRARMLLEALEDDLRSPKTEEAHCRRGVLTIEHIMPQKWRAHWGADIAGDPAAGHRRAELVQTLGNLTLLAGKMNPYVSNHPWLSVEVDGKQIPGKRGSLFDHSVLLLNKRLIDAHPNAWTDEDILSRTQQLAKRVTAIWQRP